MGVGEDESLEESIAVTVIATGFDVEQQNEISNTEAKKVIHALEDDQSMEQDLSREQPNPAIILPNIELEEKKETPVVKHTLEIVEDLDSKGIAPKHFAIAKDPSGVTVLKGPKSFSSDVDVLIDEIKFRIDNQLP